MAYADGQYGFRVDGIIAGSEVWSNSWAAQHDPADDDPQEFVDLLHAFYANLRAHFWTAQVSAVACSWRRLDGTDHGDGDWTVLTGANAGSLIPTECALRLSLSTTGDTRGGPFLTGFRAADLNPNGTSAVATDVMADFETFINAVQAADWDLLIDKPSVDSAVLASKARVGEVFDAIRRRRNDLPENYVALNF